MAALASRFGAWAVRALGTTWRVRVVGRDDPGYEPLRAGWHAHWLAAAYFFRDQGLAIGVSRSRDGDLVAAILACLGYADSPRGSTSRGGAALLHQMVHLLRRRTAVGMFPDGPRGPARRAKLGVVSLARLAGVPITPIAVAARPALRLRSWDRTVVPLPFARVVFHFGPPLSVAHDASEAQEEEICRRLDAELERLTRAAVATLDSAAGSKPGSAEAR